VERSSVTDDRTIRSPLPGTFYRSADPESEPYVREGQVVRPGDVVGLVEVMKTFTELKAEVEGVVERFLVESGDPVDAGQAVVALGD
jgi:biotin carboxyl carrier protein